MGSAGEQRQHYSSASRAGVAASSATTSSSRTYDVHLCAIALMRKQSALVLGYTQGIRAQTSAYDEPHCRVLLKNHLCWRWPMYATGELAFARLLCLLVSYDR